MKSPLKRVLRRAAFTLLFPSPLVAILVTNRLDYIFLSLDASSLHRRSFG